MKFDTYTLQARVLPAVIFMLPFFIEANYIIALLGYQIAISKMCIAGNYYSHSIVAGGLEVIS